MSIESAMQLILGFLAGIKSLEWLWKFFYAKRRDKKYTDKMAAEMRSKFNEMEISLINNVGKRLADRFEDKINQIDKRVEYLERQVNNLQISNASIKNLMEGLKKYFNKEVTKIESQYKLILQAIRSRTKK